MPVRNRPVGGQRVSRRQAVVGAVLAVAVAGPLSGCGLRLESDEPGAQSLPSPDVDETARERAAVAADELRVLAARVRALRPDASSVLRRIAVDHRDHATALRPHPAPTASEASSGSPSGPTGRTTPTTPTAPTAPPTGAAAVTLSRGTALSVLLDAEIDAQAAALAEVTRVGPEVARLLASVSAARAVHVTLLRPLAGDAGSTS